MQMSEERLKEIIESHGKWLRGEENGQCANLSDANLSDADLRYANLSGANLRYANLSDADLRYANLNGANLSDYIIQIVRIGSRKRTTTYNVTKDNVQCGCWNNYKGGTLAEFEERINDVYSKSGKMPHEQFFMEYSSAILFFKMAKDFTKKIRRCENDDF